MSTDRPDIPTEQPMYWEAKSSAEPMYWEAKSDGERAAQREDSTSVFADPDAVVQKLQEEPATRS